ncbi:SRF-TF-domain-containing protein [Basidiobolus meristosporus CBS 931.73]|uniref:SRF-TF-domain-containing protein n=1 Tax=Basidiobolus meristosporus CBS 931.73 TaxID=1314790 RepID=A0A1Y1YJL6_9FUNG|nr:SRF-TF-domain-containing protein [Basidiobolus meristosporus CBS 931.73]|eukprot:ORX98199.1 SRF-TF-domain-containing protein [Basidiobolus meristosporus CBS 931.73]
MNNTVNRAFNNSGVSPITPKAEQLGSKREFEEDDDIDSDEATPKNQKRAGRRKIKIEYIEDKSRRHITFSKRKAGIMKKAYELSTLTGTQVLLLVVSETGLVYTFTTPKLQPLVTQPEGKNLIQSCLNAPDPAQSKENTTASVSVSLNIPQFHGLSTNDLL